MPSYLIRHDFAKSQPRWNRTLADLFGARNEGAHVEAETPAQALQDFAQRHHLNAWYLEAREAAHA
jgi:hypothetical protein